MSLPFIVGLGSHHGDDRAGWLMLDRLHDRGYPSSFLYRARFPAEILDIVEPNRSLMICDACQSRTPTAHANGSYEKTSTDVSERVHRLHWPTDRIQYERRTGSHDLGLNEVLCLARQFQSIPDFVDIWVVEGSQWQADTQPSLAIQLASEQIASSIWSHVHA